MLFIDDQGNYPRHIGDVQLIKKSYVYGDALPAGWHEVQPSPSPQTTENQKVIELSPEQIDGVYYQKFEVVNLTAEELAIQEMDLKDLRAMFLGEE